MRCAARISSGFFIRSVVIVAVVLLAVAGSASTWAQTARTIRVVVSVPAGGAIDALVRILADEVARSGQTIVIDSRPGAGGVIAAEAVARAVPDGNTLLINTQGMLINAILRKVRFDPLTS